MDEMLKSWQKLSPEAVETFLFSNEETTVVLAALSILLADNKQQKVGLANKNATTVFVDHFASTCAKGSYFYASIFVNTLQAFITDVEKQTQYLVCNKFFDTVLTLFASVQSDSKDDSEIKTVRSVVSLLHSLFNHEETKKRTIGGMLGSKANTMCDALSKLWSGGILDFDHYSYLVQILQKFFGDDMLYGITSGHIDLTLKMLARQYRVLPPFDISQFKLHAFGVLVVCSLLDSKLPQAFEVLFENYEYCSMFLKTVSSMSHIFSESLMIYTLVFSLPKLLTVRREFYLGLMGVICTKEAVKENRELCATSFRTFISNDVTEIGQRFFVGEIEKKLLPAIEEDYTDTVLVGFLASLFDVLPLKNSPKVKKVLDVAFNTHQKNSAESFLVTVKLSKVCGTPGQQEEIANSLTGHIVDAVREEDTSKMRKLIVVLIADISPDVQKKLIGPGGEGLRLLGICMQQNNFDVFHEGVKLLAFFLVLLDDWDTCKHIFSANSFVKGLSDKICGENKKICQEALSLFGAIFDRYPNAAEIISHPQFNWPKVAGTCVRTVRESFKTFVKQNVLKSIRSILSSKKEASQKEQIQPVIMFLHNLHKAGDVGVQALLKEGVARDIFKVLLDLVIGEIRFSEDMNKCFELVALCLCVFSENLSVCQSVPWGSLVKLLPSLLRSGPSLGLCLMLVSFMSTNAHVLRILASNTQLIGALFAFMKMPTCSAQDKRRCLTLLLNTLGTGEGLFEASVTLSHVEAIYEMAMQEDGIIKVTSLGALASFAATPRLRNLCIEKYSSKTSKIMEDFGNMTMAQKLYALLFFAGVSQHAPSIDPTMYKKYVISLTILWMKILRVQQ